MNTLINKYDPLESLIFEEGIRIQAVDIHTEMDLMLIILNTKATLHQKISSYASFQKATGSQLSNYELIGNGTGIHWPELDEDLSLKGFLHDELRQFVNNKNKAA